MYLPLRHPEMVRDIARVGENDMEGAIGFANNWGSMGDTKGSPVSLLLAHARTVRQLLSLITWIREKNDRAIEELFASSSTDQEGTTSGERRFEAVVAVGESAHALIRARSFSDLYDTPAPGRSSSRELALEFIANVIEANLQDVWLMIAPSRETPGRIERKPFLLTLPQYIYWHLSDVASGVRSYAQCLQCQKWFEREHGLQKYCPADGTGESLCSIRARQAKFNLSRKGSHGTKR